MVNRKSFILKLSFIFVRVALYAQHDSVALGEVTVSAYPEDRPVLRLPSSVFLIDSSSVHKHSGQSMLPVLNAGAGIRMEERSPGSYRLSIRGSLLRSPFGVRNVKVYMDEIPLTNAGGETYLNLVDVNCIYGMEVLKGPDGSLFGASSGGVLKIIPVNLHAKSSFVNAQVAAGSFGLVQQHVGLQQNMENNTFYINQGRTVSNGYRENSMLAKHYLQLADQFRYSEKGALKLMFLFADLQYRTPGGLTPDQFRDNPVQARPATAMLPGAVSQQAGVHNRTIMGGVTHEYTFNNYVRHVITLFGSSTLFRNPFITNFEEREESNGGARTWLEFKNRNDEQVRLTFNVGAEAQQMHSLIGNYTNERGEKDSVLAVDDVNTTQGFVFTRFVADLHNRWILESSLSYNYTAFNYSRRAPLVTERREKILTPQLMPRLAVSYLLNAYLSLRAVVSRGYSAPTLQEIRGSDNMVNTSLQAEYGWNHEAGLRWKSSNGRWWYDASLYYYHLQQAIVRRVNEAGQEYFVNAGSTQQPGFESQLSWQVIRERKEKFVRALILSNAYTFQPFFFADYISDNRNYSGNKLTGVPQHVSVTGLSLVFPLQFYFFGQYNYTAAIPLNDANTAFATDYHLLQVKAGWRWQTQKRFGLDISMGVDNLLDQHYSLGNDLNAVGGRYYNAAPVRNYFAKLSAWF